MANNPSPRLFCVPPRKGNETSDHYAGIRRSDKPVFPAAQPIHSLTRATAAHSTPASPRNKATLSLKMRVEREQHAPCKRSTRQSVSALLPSFKIGRDQPNLIDAGAAHDVDGPGDIGKAHRVITLDEGDFLGALLEDVRKARAKRFPSGIFFIDLQLPRIQNLNDNRLLHRLRLLRLVWRGLRDQRVQT